MQSCKDAGLFVLYIFAKKGHGHLFADRVLRFMLLLFGLKI
jgi:hypothetical protein